MLNKNYATSRAISVVNYSRRGSSKYHVAQGPVNRGVVYHEISSKITLQSFLKFPFLTLMSDALRKNLRETSICTRICFQLRQKENINFKKL